MESSTVLQHANSPAPLSAGPGVIRKMLKGLGKQVGRDILEVHTRVSPGGRAAALCCPARLPRCAPGRMGVFWFWGRTGWARSASWLSVHSGTGPISSGLLSHPHPSAVLFFPTSSPQQFLLLTLQLSTLSAFLPLWIKTAHLRGVGG